MAQMEPMFMDVTWGAGGSTAQLTLEISSNAQLYCKNSEVMMHLTCTNMSFTDIKNALDKVQYQSQPLLPLFFFSLLT